MKNKIFVAGTVRNCANTLESEVRTIERAFGEKCDLFWLVIESDSEDESPKVLESLKGKISNFNYKSLGELRFFYPERTDRLAICRNEYLKDIKALDSSFEFVVVADFDGINSRLTPEAIESCWSIKDWSVLTANQSGPYFDIWALRHPTWSPDDWMKEFNRLRGQRESTSKALKKSLYSKMITIPVNSEPIEVESAFGGIAIYRKNCFDHGEYVGSVEGRPVCEHVALHKSIRISGGKILINPKLINAGYTSHTLILRRLTRLKTFLKGLLNKYGIFV